MEPRKQKGGTPKGVRKPHNNFRKETSGSAKQPRPDSFSDVLLACVLFLRGREVAGEMKPSPIRYGRRAPK
jgi:hypothetical protein